MSADQPERAERRLAAILAADVAGYSRLMEGDEEGTLAALKAIRRELGDPKIAEHRGRIVKTTGDGMLVEFASIVDAVRCAVEMQQGMAIRNADVPPERRVEFRIGINLGDIISDERDIYGDGVNVAARLETLAKPGGICVSRVVHDQVQGKLDVAFDDQGAQQVKNIARPVHIYSVKMTATAPERGPALALPDKPSLAVLPFQNMSGDPEQEYFADGMVEEITTAIARLPWLFVIARNSAFTYKGRAVDVKQAARELGVRYVLEGSVRKAGNRVRITGQLIDTATGAHIWADRFDGALDDIFDLQDQVASSVAGAIEPKLRQSEIERAARKPTESLDAYDLLLRARAQYQRLTDDSLNAAMGLARRALEMDAAYAPPAALIGACRAHQTTRGQRPSEAEVVEAMRLARWAIEQAKDDPDALWMGGLTLALLGGDRAAAATALDRATGLNPNCATAWAQRANVHCFVNEPDAAIPAVKRAIRLSPFDPLGHLFRLILGYAYMLAAQYEEAINWVDRSIHENPTSHAALRMRVALCGYLGRTEEARESISNLLTVNPVHTVTWFRTFGGRFLSPGTLAVWEEGLRRAGLPEE
jgi:adenylate cyclase